MKRAKVNFPLQVNFLIKSLLSAHHVSRFSPAHTIAKFAKKALLDRLPGGTPPKAAISGFVFVCRQLYSTCDGLMVLNPYELHQCVANAWIKVNVSRQKVGWLLDPSV